MYNIIMSSIQRLNVLEEGIIRVNETVHFDSFSLMHQLLTFLCNTYILHCMFDLRNVIEGQYCQG